MAEPGVMVVDDDRYILLVAKELFEPEGIEVVTAGSGRECLKELEKGFQGVILVDIMMPDMDGWDTVREIVDRGYSAGNIILMLTAIDVPGPKGDDLKEYVIDYITKPFDPEEFVAVVKDYLRYFS
ncbi:MAG: response regulator [Methanomicrobiaceae archaeon]|nr:response regulator [Methanomicrobiaceae archaeon]MDD5419316.1 response regulator [Methanomicrobiaceae archaeon]